MQGTTWYYFATDQWRYEEIDNQAQKSPVWKSKHSYLHNADYNQVAIRLGWLPSYPQFDRNPLSFAKKITIQLILMKFQRKLSNLNSKEGYFTFLPLKILMLTKINLKRSSYGVQTYLASSGKGAEYFMKHLLGAENGLLAKTQ